MVRMIHDLNLDTGPGSQTVLSTIDHDLSRAQSLRISLALTKAITDAGDTLNIRFQEYSQGVWNTRARFPQYLGNITVSVTAPEEYEMVIPALEGISNADVAYEPSGSASASEITAGQVIRGPFKGWWFNTGPAQAGQHLRQARYRLKIDITDANSNADFEGRIEVWSDVPNTVVA